MKKTILTLLCLILSLSFFGGCKKEEEKTETTSDRAVVLDEIGLSYTVPESWLELEGTNILPLTLVGEYSFAEILYLYVTEEELAKINSGEETLKTVGEPICEIAVVNNADFQPEGDHKAIFAYFNENEIVGEQGDYTYYLFSDSVYAPQRLSGEHLENYNKAAAAVSDLKESIETREFDASILEDQINYFNQYLTFDTVNLEEGVSVSSTIFASYDICMVNFGRIEGYPQSNEFETLSEVNFITSKMNNAKIGVIHIPYEAYNEANIKAVIDAKTKVDATVLTLLPDEYIENWVKNNLNVLPSTVFVDTNGKVVGEIVEEQLTSQGYLEEIEKRLEMIKAEQ